jgi:mRNA-degrading endonuclease RelE of RelBE toxin-antitoxin system
MTVPSKIQFVDENIRDAFEKLETGKERDKQLQKWISRAFNDLQENCFCGIQIPKKLIPKEYKDKYQLDNLWKYNLPNAWRLLYYIEGGKVVVLTIILDWMSHKEYERLFKY